MSNTEVYRAYIPTEERKALVYNSNTMKVGSWVKQSGNSVAVLTAKTDYVAGRVIRFETKNGVSLETPSFTAGSVTGTWTASTKQYVAAADNQTVDQVYAIYEPAKEDTEFLVTVDAAKTTTVTNPNGYYYGIKTSDATVLDESDATLTETGMQFYCTDAYRSDETTKIIVKVVNRVTSLKQLS